MAWPTSSKAGTTNVDQGSDKIRLARPDIKQNIDNTNAIIDTFTDMNSPSANDLLVYNGSSFSPSGSRVFGTAILQLNNPLANGTNLDYSGTFTVTGGTHLGITAGAVDNAGKSTFHLPQGTYNISHNPIGSGTYGSGSVVEAPVLNFTDSDPDSAGEETVFQFKGTTTGFYFRMYYNNVNVILNKDHDLCFYYTYTGASSFIHPTILINRLA